MSDERFPVQRDLGSADANRTGRRPPGTVSMAEAEEAYAAYSAQYGTDQSLKRLGERGGFGYREIAKLLGREPTTWQPLVTSHLSHSTVTRQHEETE